ncbi:DotH/IcmK family type IV secretion protein [Cellvibrio sp. QJXJ]|uniref:DotH/IcmK family type IV secretion protein n=1 Tax=Cellvibrio sp. QJXJ TaxID=2964606 RepID=UPI0021C31C8D|nr:DotH/IcmK family type IV secretion protein [Cellvibrio sp. QJXJ]UUA75184.1 DotH/IcmK family type IV secretion protein [Cellvibrio sp. QJXJ]
MICRLAAFFILYSLMMTPTYAQEYNVIPNEEVRRAVEEEKGGPPVLYRQVMEQNQEYETAMEYMPKATPKSRTVSLSMDNLNVPFEVEVATGYITTLTFIDSNGNPYPHKISRVGNNTTFIVCTGSGEDCVAKKEDIDIAHILTIGTPKHTGRSNLRVMFNGLYKAVQIPLVVKRTTYHDEVTIMLPVTNPDSKIEPLFRNTSQRTIQDSDDYYARALIDGISVSNLPDAVELSISVENRIGQEASSANIRAIYARGNTYLKAPLRNPNPRPSALTNGFMNDVVYRFDGRAGVVTALDESGQIVVITLTLPENMLGYRSLGSEK